MKWVKWVVNGSPHLIQNLEKDCRARFESIEIKGRDYYQDTICSFMSIETCSYKYNIANMSNNDIIIFGDIELFNMAVLCEKYEVNEVIFGQKSLIMLYEKCGKKIFDELNGEFSFVLFDKRKNEINLIVDPLGVKQLFWNYSNGILNASTDLFLLSEIIDMEQWNKQYFKDFIELNGFYTGRETPRPNIFRVLPGHYVSINLNSNEVVEKNYWNLSEIKTITRYKTEEEYFEQFRKVLAQALERRLLPEKNGIAMSGGLDSTTLFVVSKSMIAESDLKPVSGVFSRLHDCDESTLIKKVCDMYDTIPGLVNCDNSGMLVNYPEHFPFSDEPHCPSLSSSFAMKIMDYASKNSIVNLIDGYAADHLLAGTPLTSIDMIKRGKVLSIFRYIKDICYMFDESVFLSINKNLIKLENAEIDEVLLSNIKSSLGKVKTHSQKHIYAQIYYARTFKLLDRDIAPMFNLSMKHPFLDKDLIEFVYTIPGEMLLQKTMDKYIIREGMKNYLPSDVINKTQKTQHVSLSFGGVNKVWRDIFPIINQYRQEDYYDSDISKEEWRSMLHDFRAGKTFTNRFLAMLCLELWLAEN